MHSTVMKAGRSWWKTTISSEEIEYEPIEFQARVVTVRRLREDDWRVERTMSYVQHNRVKREVRTTVSRFAREDVAFKAAIRFLDRTDVKYE